MTKKPTKCFGFDKFTGRCINPPGAEHSPYYCQRCDNLRMKSLNGDFKAIAIAWGMEDEAPDEWIDRPLPDDLPDKRTK